jgi:DNA polymerase elongation subunit (family B)/ribonuclease HI
MSTSSNYKSDYIYVINWSHEEDVFNDNIVIRLYGYDKNRQSVMVRIEDFTVFCYIELPPDINWLNYLAPLKNSIKEKFKSKPIKYELEFKKKLYNPDYQPSKNKDVKYEQILRPYLKVTFTTHSKMKDFMSQARFGLHVSGLGKVTVSIFNGDNSLNPSLRMICINNINPVGWIKLKDAFVVDKIDFETTKALEYIVKTENVAKVPDQLVKKLPVIFPSVLSFDIETYSSKLISMPDPDTPADVVFQIGCTFRSVKGKVTKYILTLKECDEIEDVTVIKCKSERVLLTDFAGLITKLDPDIITGYNIYGFDYQYIIKRAELCKCLNEFMKQSSINNRVCEKGKIEWESSAFGIQEHTYVDADGRLVFDMMPYMKRSFKLPNYRLETVCDEFLKTNKDPLKYRDIFECYEKGDGKSLALCAKYCVQDSYVVYLLFDKLNVWYDIAESANTNQVPMFYLYAKGQQIKMYAQVFSYCHHNNIVMNVPRNLASERYSGATVLNPVAGIYKNIIPFDFASLYPSIIMAYNIDYTTYITNDKLKDEDCDVMDWEEHSCCLIKGTNVTINHLSMPIELLINNRQNIMTFDMEKNGLTLSEQINFFNQGDKECIELTFQDGTKISCTPDHKFLNSENKWIEAKDIKMNQDKIKFGYNPPKYDPLREFEECKGWKQEFKTWNLEITNFKDYEYCLVFMRLLGYLLSDGSVGKEKSVLYMGHNIDLENMLTDIELICGYRPKPSRKDHVWNVVLPKPFAKKIKEIDGLVIGKRLTQNASLPYFIMKDDLPLPLLREFLAGLYGGDGHCPVLNTTANVFSSISFSQSLCEEKLDSLQDFVQNIQKLLERFNIKSIIQPPRKHKDAKIKSYSISIRCPIENLSDFTEKIGFRYCVHKSYRLQIAYSYEKLRDRIVEQRNKVLQKVIEKCNKNIEEDIPINISQSLKLSYEEIKKEETILNNFYSLPNYDWVHDKIKDCNGTPKKRCHFIPPHFPSREEYLKEIDAISMFKNNNNENKNCYAVKLYNETLPTYNLKLIGVRNIGIQPTYDIEIKNTHNFLANGCVVHNCSHDPNYKPLKKKKEMTEDDEKKYQERQEKRDSKKICKHFHHKFAKASSVGKGVIPTILETLLSARKQVRKILESVSKEHKLISLFLDGKLSEEYSEDLKDFPSTKKLMDENSITKLKQLQQDLDVQKSVLDKRQLAYKVNANSMYGALGAGKGYLPFVSGAMTVTYIGRTSIEKAVNYIKSNWEDALVVYGDTDSCFINFRRFEDHTPEKYNEIWKFAEQVVEQIRHIFPSPMKLEFEGKIYATYFILSKKRYIAQPCDINGVMDKKLYKKGVVLQRRDNCRFLKEIYEATLWKILDNAEKLKFDGLSTHQIMKHPVVQETLDMIITYINKLFSREYTAQDFVITKGLNRVDYIGKRKPAHASLADKLGKRGITVPVNTRLEYVLINVDKKDKLQEDIIEEIGYFKEHRDVLRIDYFYYLEHQVMKPLDEILKVAFKVDDIVKNNVSLRAHKQLINKNIREVFHPQFEIDGEIKKPSQTQAKQKKQVSKESKEGKNNGSIIQMFQNLKNVNKVSSEKSALYTDAGCNAQTGDEAWASVVNQNSQDMIEQHKDLLSDFKIREVNLPVGNRHIIVAKFSDVQTQQNNGGELLGFCAGLRIALKQGFKQILIDSDLIYKYWSVGKISSSAREKMDAIKLKYINEVIDLRKKFETSGGVITKICGGENKADLGYHKD